MTGSTNTELIVHGSVISYYTGKLEGYLRYKEIPYRLVRFSPSIQRLLKEKTGNSQMPSVELPDGRFMTDTTPMIDWFETQFPGPLVIPADPLQAFFSRLIEDYAEEWMWRPAMHFRWSYRQDRLHLSRKIVDEIMPGVPLPSLVQANGNSKKTTRDVCTSRWRFARDMGSRRRHLFRDPPSAFEYLQSKALSAGRRADPCRLRLLRIHV